MIKITAIQATRTIGAVLILLSGNAFAVAIPKPKPPPAPVYATQAALNAEVTTRANADIAEVAARNTAIGAEATARDTAIATAVKASGSFFSYSMTCGVSGTDACKVGTVGPGGGWIFFVDYNEQYSEFNYLEAAPADIPPVAWCSNADTSISAVAGWSARAVGAGQANTNAMTGFCSTGAANSAAAYSTPTSQAGDWFLGTLGDMMLMYTNLSNPGVVGSTSNYPYWRPPDSASGCAWFITL